ncbi:hypothetical protein PanWU01x14_079080 [Parasponia andersonii]|uniref:Transmembrane protein n=1 Tax=Parasponia andersonii TaxID=3476 RepID=A0A2P5DB64_PARAD|nr:hypothetical protein PanWU01x14_079080 [Parasponia andersonii]
MLPVVLVVLITFLAALVAVLVWVVDMMEILVAVETPAWMIHLETINRMIHWKEITGMTTMIRMTLPKELEKKNYMGSDTYCLL